MRGKPSLFLGLDIAPLDIPPKIPPVIQGWPVRTLCGLKVSPDHRAESWNGRKAAHRVFSARYRTVGRPVAKSGGFEWGSEKL